MKVNAVWTTREDLENGALLHCVHVVLGSGEQLMLSTSDVESPSAGLLAELVQGLLQGEQAAHEFQALLQRRRQRRRR